MKIKEWVNNQFRFSIQEIAFTGIFVGLYVLLNSPFMTINVGIMRSGLEYVCTILIGLTSRKVLLAIFSAIVADTLSWLANGSSWSPYYALIPPMVALISFVFKNYLTTQNMKLWWSVNISIVAITALLPFVLIFIYENNVDKYKTITISTVATKAIIWTMMSLVALLLVGLNVTYLLKRKEEVRKVVSIVILVAVVILISIWLWGPFAAMLNAKMYGSSIRSYDVYIIPRVLKTPVILLLYSVIIIPIYKAYEVISNNSSKHHKW